LLLISSLIPSLYGFSKLISSQVVGMMAHFLTTCLWLFAGHLQGKVTTQKLELSQSANERICKQERNIL
jgi:hypothetical protein